MAKLSTLTAEAFNGLLAWLDPDRERAGEKYENIRHQLIKMFAWQRCPEPEELADETIMRVTKNLREIRDSYAGEPGRYFYGVARNLLVEASKHKAMAEPPTANDLYEDASRNQLDYCFGKCLAALPAHDQELLLTYYQSSKEGKLDGRRELAAKMGITLNALRLRVHHLKTTLHKCIEQCAEAGKQRSTNQHEHE